MLHRLRVTRTDTYMTAFAGQCLGNGSTNAACPTRDDRFFALKSQIHVFSP
jgi:hypothetical protein